jgi:adenylosuccinate synthase
MFSSFQSNPQPFMIDKKQGFFVAITVLLGLQWGDEGKGKMVDILSSENQHVVRSHGGANAGHTLVIKGLEYKFHLIPSGILYPHTICYLAGGVVVDPDILLEELNDLKNAGITVKDRFYISLRAHLLFPFHKFIDQHLEQMRGQKNIGTTGKGIGPCYTDKTSRSGLTVGELIHDPQFKEKLLKRYEGLDAAIQKKCSFEQLFDKTQIWKEKLQGFVKDVEHDLAQASKRGEGILLEGAHGTMLDISYGTYPFVTSSGCIASSVLAGAGLGPMGVKRVCGIIKSYTTRVGSGPLPTSLTENEQLLFKTHQEAREIGTTTGRLRRMGWLDIPLIRRSIELSSVTDLVLTKLDILDSLEKIKICTSYTYKGKTIEVLPLDTELLEHLTPHYITLEGWKTKTSDIKHYQHLPQNAKKYINVIIELLKTPIKTIFVGPDREQTLKCP